MADYPDGSDYIDLNAVEDRDMRRLVQRMRRAELDAIRHFQSQGDVLPERLLTGHEGLSGRKRS
jgi:hypothetical protein